MLTRRFVLCGLIAAPAVVKAESLMKVYSLPERYATVWGVGHDLEVIEHAVWSKEDALLFAKGPLYKFREVTDITYEVSIPPLPAPIAEHWTERHLNLKEKEAGVYKLEMTSDFNLVKVHWTERPHLTPPNLLDNSPVVQENGFTDIATFKNMNAWRESLRPDLGGRSSDEWIQSEIRLRDEAGLGPLAWYPGAGLVKIPVT